VADHESGRRHAILASLLVVVGIVIQLVAPVKAQIPLRPRVFRVSMSWGTCVNSVVRAVEGLVRQNPYMHPYSVNSAGSVSQANPRRACHTSWFRVPLSPIPT
jgi:hypothetical protein